MVTPKQDMQAIKAGGSVIQKSNVATEQHMAEVEAEHDVSQIIELTSADIEALSTEIPKLREEIASYDPSARHEIAALSAAEVAIDAGDTNRALSHLKSLGRWVLDFATKVGASVIAKVIERQIGL